MIKLDLYKIFAKVAESQSFSKAAKELFITQPAVSQAIAQLESELNTLLFRRTSKGVILTNAGQLLYEYVDSALKLINVGEKKLIESKNLLFGELKIGVGDTISKYFLMKYLERFHIENPNIKLRIINRTTPELCSMLKSGEIDIAVCNLPIEDSSFEIKECMEIHDIFVCGEKYKSLSESPISLEDLTSYPLILLETKSNSRQFVESYLDLQGIKIIPEIELGSHELLLEFAKINLGIACVIKEFSQEYLDNKIIFEVNTIEQVPARSIGFCFLKSVSLSPPSTRFIQIVEGK